MIVSPVAQFKVACLGKRVPPRDVVTWLIVCIFGISLFGTITNFVYLSVSFVLLFFACGIVLLARYLFVGASALAWSLLALYVYFFLSTLLYAPESFLHFEFYRRDGNFFITFLPILIFPMLQMSVAPQLLGERLLWWGALTGGLAYGYYRMDPQNPVFHGLFYAHNAAGGYYAMLCAMAAGLFFHAKQWRFLFLGGICLGLLLVTDSRGSVLGLLLALLTVNRWMMPFRWPLFAALFIGLLCLVIFYAYPVWELNGKASMGFSVDYAALKLPIDRSYTLIDRLFYLWPRASELWLRSPFVGFGFGGYNDLPYHFVGMAGLLSSSVPEQVVHSDWHAHNTYFHVLAETGLLGLGLLLFFLYRVDVFLRQGEPRGLCQALRLALWVGIWSSFTEHRLFTPSQMLPFTLLLGLVLSYQRYGGANVIEKSAESHQKTHYP